LSIVQSLKLWEVQHNTYGSHFFCLLFTFMWSEAHARCCWSDIGCPDVENDFCWAQLCCSPTLTPESPKFCVHNFFVFLNSDHWMKSNSLTLSLLMLYIYIYGAPSKARNLMSHIYGWDFLLGIWTMHFFNICMKNQQIQQLFTHHDPNAFNIYWSMKSAAVNQTSRCDKVKEPPQQQNN
jgi:hypothetical protein